MEILLLGIFLVLSVISFITILLNIIWLLFLYDLNCIFNIITYSFILFISFYFLKFFKKKSVEISKIVKKEYINKYKLFISRYNNYYLNCYIKNIDRVQKKYKKLSILFDKYNKYNKSKKKYKIYICSFFIVVIYIKMIIYISFFNNIEKDSFYSRIMFDIFKDYNNYNNYKHNYSKTHFFTTKRKNNKEEETFIKYLKSFGLTKETLSEQTLKEQYRKLCKKYHPDNNKNINAAKQFQEVQKRYKYLKQFV